MREPVRLQARRWLVWCLVALLPCLSLGIGQRQTLGPLHVHAPATAEAGAVQGHHGTAPWQTALDWWWAQVLAQTQARQHARAHADGRAHAHDAWQRHHHDPQDASVMALDTHAEDLEVQGAAALLLLPVLGVPADGLRIDPAEARPAAWPRAGAARFGSRATAPPLQPPRG